MRSLLTAFILIGALTLSRSETVSYRTIAEIRPENARDHRFYTVDPKINNGVCKVAFVSMGLDEVSLNFPLGKAGTLTTVSTEMEETSSTSYLLTIKIKCGEHEFKLSTQRRVESGVKINSFFPSFSPAIYLTEHGVAKLDAYFPYTPEEIRAGLVVNIRDKTPSLFIGGKHPSKYNALDTQVWISVK